MSKKLALVEGMPLEMRRAVEACSRLPGVAVVAISQFTLCVRNLKDPAMQSVLMLHGFRSIDDQYVWTCVSSHLDDLVRLAAAQRTLVVKKVP